jgi:hypothetical protein
MGKKVFTNIVSMLTTGVSCALGAAVYFFIFTMASEFHSSLELSPFDQAILQIIWRNEKGHIGNTWRHIFFYQKGHGATPFYFSLDKTLWVERVSMNCSAFGIVSLEYDEGIWEGSGLYINIFFNLSLRTTSYKNYLSDSFF